MSPGGIALASGGEDRDGLAMDVLHLRLGPVLSYWPSNLTVGLTLQGDVVTAVSDVVTDRVSIETGTTSGDHPRGLSLSRLSAAARLDALTSLLALAGSPRHATLARRARDAVLDVSTEEALTKRTVEQLGRVLQRSRLLRWSLVDLAPVAATGLLAGDVYARMLKIVELAEADLAAAESNSDVGTAAHAAPSTEPDTARTMTDLGQVLPSLLTGLEVASVRLAIASVVGLSPVLAVPASSLGSGHV
jgi:hypothetical protein